MNLLQMNKMRFAEARRMYGREPKGYATLEAAAERMRQTDPWVRDDRLLHLARHATALKPDGTYRWRFDGMQKVRFSWTGSHERLEACLAATKCPTLLVAGEKSHFNQSDEVKERGKDIPNARWVTVSDAGHNVHVDNPEGLLEVLEEFLAEETETPGAAKAAGS